MNNKVRLKKPLFFNALLLISTVIFMLIAAEFLLRFTSYRYFLSTSDNTRYYYKADEIKGHDISKNSPSRVYGFVGLEHEIWSNELGCFDNPYQGEKNYILLAGDSFAWGYAPFKDKVGTIIEDYLDYRVLKCGVSGYGTKQELLKVREIIGEIKSKPKLIILFYFILNDFQDDLLFPQRTVVDGYLVRNAKVYKDKSLGWQKKTISNDEIISQIEQWEKAKSSRRAVGIQAIRYWLRSHSILYHMVRNIPIVYRIANKLALTDEQDITNIQLIQDMEKSSFLSKAWKEHLGNIKEFKKLSKGSNIKLLVILIPPKLQIYNELEPDGYSLKKINTMLKIFLEEENIEYLDLTPIFKEYVSRNSKMFLNKDLYWRYEPHWNIRGNKLAGLSIANYITNNNLIEISNIEMK